uniref:SPRY domain-containing SOCS box protein 2 n=1 Tax=Ciona intestinalis TaxID=7719 RepID=Q8WST3_CIOIN|nr:Ci-META3 [Ciona intestinalis]BAB79622.1 Ci-META3 [Ciona intestinalis]|eukprot:NP_001027614.1 Ci-META3 [Ciona intestinalis]
MGQKISSSSERSSRQFSFIEPILARTTRTSSNGRSNRSSNSPPKNSRRHSVKDGHHRRTHHHHSNGNHLSASGMESECPHRLDVLLDMPAVGVDVQQQHGWNSEDKSVNVFVKDNDLTVHRHPVAQSTDGVRGKVGYSRGLHCWEVTWNTRQRGTHAMVGVCTSEAALTCMGYRSLIGQNNESWGWDLGRNKLFHGGKVHRNEKKTYPSYLESDENFVVPEKVLVVLDMDEGTLSFVADKQYLGVAFTGLKGKTLYPVISCVWGHCEVGIKYINGLEPAPLPMAELCRRRIRMSMGKKHLHEVEKLPLPHLLQEYVLYR